MINTSERKAKITSVMFIINRYKNRYNWLLFDNSQWVSDFGYAWNSKLIVAITIDIEWFTMWYMFARLVYLLSIGVFVILYISIHKQNRYKYINELEYIAIIHMAVHPLELNPYTRPFITKYT